MKTPAVIGALGALAHEHRIAIYRLLVQRGPEGLPAGAIGERVGLVPSSLTFHLQNLQRAGLIAQRRHKSHTAGVVVKARIQQVGGQAALQRI